MIQALTFDFWDCIVADDSDEPKRAAAGLRTKQAARRALLVDEILAHHPDVGARADEAFAHCNERFRHWWKVEHRTPCVADRLTEAFVFLGLDRTPGFDAVVAGWEQMEVDVPPDLAPGIAEALDALAGRVRLGIISDAIVTPGLGLREILRGYGLLDHFELFVFSDEAGASKPSPRVFAQASEGFGVPYAALAHIGDREANDVAGPLGVGAKAILYTGVVDRGSAETRAHAVCRDHRELPALLDTL